MTSQFSSPLTGEQIMTSQFSSPLKEENRACLRFAERVEVGFPLPLTPSR